MAACLDDVHAADARRSGSDADRGVIVPVNGTNLDAAARVHALSWRASHRAICAASFVAQHTACRQRAYIRGKLDTGSRFWLFVQSGVPAGVVSVTAGQIGDLYVLPALQGRGIGTRLLRHAMDACAGPCTLWVLASNDGAQRLYVRCGFRPTGNRIVHPGWIDELEYAGPDAWKT